MPRPAHGREEGPSRPPSRGDRFIVTYGDGLARHRRSPPFLEFSSISHGKLATVDDHSNAGAASALSSSRNSSEVMRFREKADAGLLDQARGSFVFERRVLSYLSTADTCTLEREPIERLSREGEADGLSTHPGEFFPMDTLSRPFGSQTTSGGLGKAPWKILVTDFSGGPARFCSPAPPVFSVGTLVRQLIEVRANRSSAWSVIGVPQSGTGSGSGPCWNGCGLVRGDILDQALLERVLGEYEVDYGTAPRRSDHRGPLRIETRLPHWTVNIPWKPGASSKRARSQSPRPPESWWLPSDKAYGGPTLSCRTPKTVLLPGVIPTTSASRALTLIAPDVRGPLMDRPLVIARCGNLLRTGRSQTGTGSFRGRLGASSATRGPIIRSDGSLIRDYIYVDDGALAIHEDSRGCSPRIGILPARPSIFSPTRSL